MVNVTGVMDRIRAAELRAGRADGSVSLCAVSKTFPPEAVVEAAAAGVTTVGENRVQEASDKRPAVEAMGATGLRWHLIGHLQSNKVRRAVEIFDVIETLDSVELVDRVDRIAGELGRTIDVLVQVDLGHEPTKSGADESDVPAIVERTARAENLRLRGLMTVPPLLDDLELVRPYFRRLRELRDRLNAELTLDRPLVDLSMGMSHDFEVAIEEGATIVRVGSAIFGARG
jgi:pyridoxal phosphate enzyme (YggS family)